MFSIDCYRIKLHHLFHDMLLENKIKPQLLKYVYIVHDAHVADFIARICQQFNDYLADIFLLLYVYVEGMFIFLHNTKVLSFVFGPCKKLKSTH